MTTPPRTPSQHGTPVRLTVNGLGPPPGAAAHDPHDPHDPEFIPYVISWNLTARCNLRCRHCYIDASKPMPNELGPDEALRVVDQIARVNSESILILTGGEPLLRPDLDAIVGRAAGHGMVVVLGTNGTGLTDERARRLASLGLSGVGISVDSLLDARHDGFRGVGGALAAAKRGIDAARRAGLDVQVQMTLTRDNVGELADVVTFSRGAGARAVMVFFLVCTGRGQGLVDLTPHEYERILGRLVETRADGIMIRPRCAPTFRRVLAQRTPDSILLESDVGRCMAAKNYCRITPDGDVTPCPYMPLVAGSLRSSTFGEIWRSAELFGELRHPALKGRCGACEYKDLCGGCRARALAMTADPLGEDPWCVYEPGTDDPLEPPAAAERAEVRWTAEAQQRLDRAPVFVRKMIRRAVEAFARRRGAVTVTPELLDEARRTIRK